MPKTKLRTGYDSVTASDLPIGGDFYFAYLDGHYANYPAVKARFAHKPIATITPFGETDANIIDCETGDATPSQAAAWAKRQAAASRFPVVYCNSSTWASVRAELRQAGLWPRVGRKKCGWMEAHYDGVAKLSRGSIAKQYLGSPGVKGAVGTSPGHYDVSVVAPYWPGVDPPLLGPVATNLSVACNAAIGVVIRHFRRRKNPLSATAKKRVAALIDAATRVEKIK